MWLHTLISVLKIDSGKTRKLQSYIFISFPVRANTYRSHNITCQHAFISLVVFCAIDVSCNRRCNSVYFSLRSFHNIFVWFVPHFVGVCMTCTIVKPRNRSFHSNIRFFFYAMKTPFFQFFLFISVHFESEFLLWTSFKIENVNCIRNLIQTENNILHSIACPCSE